MDDGQGARKKAKIAKDAYTLSPLSFSNEKRDQLHAAFASAQPFPHLALSHLCDEGFLKSVREEVINGLKADYKETDIFKVLQTSGGIRFCKFFTH